LEAVKGRMKRVAEPARSNRTGLADTQLSKSGATDFDVAIIGAGPYGLSAAAYLRARGLSVAVIGMPMDFWANQMPAGMLLRSPRIASTIADPRSELTLDAFEAEAGVPVRSPLPSETFASYGRWFQRQLQVTNIVDLVQRVTRENGSFRLSLSKGQSLTSRQVVVAAGIGPFARKPPEFSELDPAQISHCYEGRQPNEFKGKRVAVIGAGQSALESAALMQEQGAQVEVIAKVSQLRWIGQHGYLHRLGPISSMLYSKYDVGPVGISRLVAWPNLLFHIPFRIKDRIRARAVRAAGAPWLLPRLANVTISPGRVVRTAQSLDSEVKLKLDDGTDRRVDHVLLGTGYRVDVSGYRFLDPSIVSAVRQVDGNPLLSKGFRSSVPGLYFIGATAAKTFGPILYFVAGTDFASRHLSAHMHCGVETLSGQEEVAA
jgi:hypothetical protein